jgi:hypothetical protein
VKNSLLLLPVSLPRALEVCRLPHHHSDPFHRLLIAQAQAEELTVSGVGKGAAAGGRSATQSAGGATTLVDCCRGKARAGDQLVDDCAPCALYSTTLFERPLFLGKSILCAKTAAATTPPPVPRETEVVLSSLLPSRACLRFSEHQTECHKGEGLANFRDGGREWLFL